MKLPNNCRKILLFRHEETWYQIVETRDMYILYRVNNDDDYTQLATGNSPVKLEQRVYTGKVK